MEAKEKPIKTIAEYIDAQDEGVRPRLLELYRLIKRLAPGAEERMSWGMPTFYLNGNLVHFAAHKHHIGFYPGAEGTAMFSKLRPGFKCSKGAAQLPNRDPLPLGTIEEVVRFRATQNLKEE